jgi:hypothetical protein
VPEQYCSDTRHLTVPDGVGAAVYKPVADPISNRHMTCARALAIITGHIDIIECSFEVFQQRAKFRISISFFNGLEGSEPPFKLLINSMTY